MNVFARFAKNILLSIDQFGNVLLLGSADETISARSYRQGELEGHRGWAIARKVIDKLFWFDPDHAAEAYAAEFSRHHMPEHYHKPRQSDDCSNAAPINKE